MERRAPEIDSSAWWKEERHGVFMDYNQNARDRTVAAAYSIRPRPDARVSTPLTWDEVPSVDPRVFTIDSVPKRFAEIGDPAGDIDATCRTTRWLVGARGSRYRQRFAGCTVAAALSES